MLESAIQLNTWWIQVLSGGSQATQSVKEKSKKAKVKYHGINSDARELGVTRQHLWEVLEGNRPSKRLLQRYKSLKASQNKEGGSN